jgi:sulfite reductase alpha subunit-like flavoprotein
MSEFGQELTILYASETGVAEDVAYSIYDILRRRLTLPVKTDVAVISVDSYDVMKLPAEQIVVFVVSTTGDGEVPHTMRNLWTFLLRRNLLSNSLSAVRTAVFGLGDSSYEKYNACARKLAARLRQLGSVELLSLGLGDDQAPLGYIGALGPWTHSLLEALGANSGNGHNIELDDTCEDQYTVTIVQSPVDTCCDERPAVRAAVDEYTTLFNDSTAHRPHLIDTCVKSLASSNNSGFVTGAKCGTGAFKSPDNTRCALPHAIVARVVRNARMTATEWPQEVRDICLDFSCSLDWLRTQAVKDGRTPRWPLFRAGDVACIHPKNPRSVVDRMLRLIPCLGSDEASGTAYLPEISLPADSFLSIKRKRDQKASSRTELQRRNRIGDFSCTALQLLTWHLDLCGMPRRSFFAGIAKFATKEEEREKLLELASAEGTSLYYEYCQRERRTYVEVLEEFPSVRVPLHHLLEVIPVLQARHYSIASSGYNERNSAMLDLCVAVTTATTPYGRKRRGLCSSYLAAAKPGEEIFLWLRSGTFANPGLDTPVLLIGPGTGVAPMRAILQERRFFMDRYRQSTGLALKAPDNDNPSTLLFFGCRRRKFDFLYQLEWEGLLATSLSIPDPDSSMAVSDTDQDYFCDKSSPLKESVCVAFSQDVPEGSAKTYVTHKLRKHGVTVVRMLEAGAHVYIAGSARSMPSGVRHAIVDCIAMYSQGGPLPVEEAERRVRDLEKTGRYLVEAWTA